MQNAPQISLDHIRKNPELVTFLDKIPKIKRMVILKPLAEKYRDDGDPLEYMRRIRRTEIGAVEVAEIMTSAKKEGFTPESIAEAEKIALATFQKAS